MKKELSFLKPYLLFIAAVLVALFLSRAGLIIWQYERVAEAQGFMYILIQGLRFDLILLGLVLFLPLSLSPLMMVFKSIKNYWVGFVNAYLLLAFVVIIFVELSSPSFIAQYDLRPNVLFVEYLKYPKEVMSTLWEAYRLQLIMTVIVSSLASYFLFKKLQKVSVGLTKIKLLNALVLMPVLFFITIIMARSTFGHRAINPSSIAFSNDPLVNTLAMSSAYSVLYATKEMMSESNHDDQYGDLSEDRVMEIIKAEMQVPEKDFTGDKYLTHHNRKAQIQRDKPLNIVIILQESLGAEFVGSLGGLPLTPEIDKLTKEGLWFDNMYATGTRSVRGIEAVVTGFLPTPQRSVVKLSKSQTNFFTIAKLLKEKGYDTSFIYGGEAHFDNMKRFFANNGFDNIIEEKDFKDPVFTASWGASDEDLFNKAHETFSKYKKDQAFFSLVFTSTNHSPFEFPDGRIELYDEEKQTVNNAVKYADYAVGEYIKKAKKSAYWDNTLFLIVADHNSRVYGSELVPIQRFHIPALLLGADVPAKTYSGLASQIDLLPTLLSMAGVDANYPAIGRDLLAVGNQQRLGRAIMQFDGTQAYMQEDGKVVVMQKAREPQQYIYQQKHLKASAERDEVLIEKALAHAIWASRAYQNSRYH